MKIYLLVESAHYESGYEVAAAFRSKKKAETALKNFTHSAYFDMVNLQEVEVDMEEDSE